MKIGILTQALHGNYGGILQNYALQQVLLKLGHEPVTIDRHMPRSETMLKRVAKYILRHTRPTYDSSLLSLPLKKKLNHRPLEFITRHINTTGVITGQQQFNEVVSNPDFDAFIVGSDQCWRPCYSANICNYFLDFATDQDVRRIAYAASFGVKDWEYTQEQTQKVKSAAQFFTAISVREDSGVDLCRDYLDITAQWVLDPTMLLGVEGFRSLVKHQEAASTYIVSYVLEDTDGFRALMDGVKNISGIEEIRNNNRSSRFTRFSRLGNYENISVEDWITNIANAKVVVTDSFHGIVFALLFNVPFIVRLNGTRGNARIESLLRDFNLEYCISDTYVEPKLPEIDWAKVNAHLKDRQKESLSFLKEALI